MTTPQSAEVVFLFRLEDQASAGMAKTENAIEGVTTATKKQSGVFTENAVTALRLTGSLLIMSGAFLRIGKSLGLFNDKQAETISNILLFTGAAASLISSLVAISKALKGTAIASAIVQAFSGPAGWVALGVGAAIAAAAVATISGLASFQTLPGQMRTVPGRSNQGQLAIVHGGEQIGRPGAGAGVTVNINGGIYTNDSSMRQMARMVSEKIREENRTRGTTLT
mgnify:CR=1 FL=1